MTANGERGLNAQELAIIYDRLAAKLRALVPRMLEEKLRAKPYKNELDRFVRDSMFELTKAIKNGEVALKEAALEYYLFHDIVPPALERAGRDFDEHINAIREAHNYYKPYANKLISGTGEDPLALQNEADYVLLDQMRSGNFQNRVDQSIRRGFYRVILNRGASRIIRRAQQDRKHLAPWTDVTKALLHASRTIDEWDDPTAAAGRVRWIQHKLQELPSKHREVLSYLYQGYTPSNIAARLGLPLGTVTSRIHRARRRAQKLLGPIS